ncbi:Zinc finger CCCH domain-containing protein 48 [Vitis vinifera]|uniref:Zinc finger CCCH domain-containing protein 48 n=1 Tax=Vitis vinifera TaxID=29760 RepID=A0A438IBA1_VITVI|nr:Zinc finger CCCH domain-containing protein 48 [Vitis vinifera]
MDVKRVQYRTPITGGGRGQGYGKKGAVCKYWLQGRCNRNPFKRWNRGNGTAKHSHGNSDPEHQDSSFLTSRGDAISQKDSQQSLILDTCNDGDKCQCLNSWFMGEGVSRLAQLEGHEKAQTSFTLEVEMELFGFGTAILAWNIQTATEYSLDGPVGQVYALETTGIDMLFAGMQDGGILVWKYNPETNSFQLITNLKGHTCDVLSLKVGRQSLYSGSKDNTIRKWDLDTLQCAQTLTGHSAAVMSLLCWENCLLSCSLDQTIKAWAYTKDGCLEVIHTHNEEHGVLALFGMHDADNKPILFCSCNDNSVHLYELPGFTERGKIFAKQGVWAIESGPGGLFFTGDGAGGVAVWKWLHKQIAEADCTE